MKVEDKELGQARENSTNAVSVYSPDSSLKTAIIEQITLANTSGADATFRLFKDDDGTTYDESTALAWDIDIPSDTMITIGCNYKMNDSAGNFAYRSSVANAITITLDGKEIT